MRTIIFLLLSFLIFHTGSFAAILSTAVDGVKLYSSPSPSSSELFDYAKGTPVKIIAKSGEWYQVVDWMKLKGWIKKSDLINEVHCVVSRTKINFRSGPGTRYSNLGRLYQGNVLKVLKTTKYWINVQVIDPNTGQAGWVHRRYVWGI